MLGGQGSCPLFMPIGGYSSCPGMSGFISLDVRVHAWEIKVHVLGGHSACPGRSELMPWKVLALGGQSSYPGKPEFMPWEVRVHALGGQSS